MEQYISTRDSGVEGIGTLPSSWNIKSFSKVNWIRARLGWKGLKADEYVDNGFPFLSAFNLVNNRLIWEPLNYITQERYDESPEIKLSVGDILLVKDGAGIGKVARIDELPLGESTVNSSLAVITARPGLDYRFLYYFLLSPLFSNIITRLRNGMGVPHLTQESMKEIKMPFPSIKEQGAIAAYLDDQVAQIDSIIAEARASIEDYKQWKLSIIHEAVTKGINADVPKRTTDISWIGEMPCSWQLIKVKRIVRIENGSDPQSEGDIPVYGSGAESFRTCGEYKEGPTVLLGRKGATLHIPHYIEGKYWNVDTAFNVVVINNMVNLKYFYYTAICFDYPAYRSQTTLPSMTQTNYNNMKVPYPDIITQNAIASFLDNKVAEIDDVIFEKESLIADLESYKRSLIYEAVTGKRKVV